MGDDKHGVCQPLAGIDRALKGRGGVFAAVGLCAEGRDKDERGRLWRRPGVE